MGKVVAVVSLGNGITRVLPWLAPAIVLLVFVYGYSILALVRESFTFDSSFVWFENFTLVLTDPLFLTAILHNAELLIVVPILMIVCTVIAVLIFETRRGARVYRAIVFLPYVLPVPVIGVVFAQLLQLNGAFNGALDFLGLHGLTQDWMGNPRIALITMGGIIVWKEMGFGVVLILARMMSISDDIYDAARIDGAGTIRMHWKITLPQLRSILVFFSISEAINMVSWVFNYVYVMTNGQGGPGNSTVVSELYIYRMAFANKAPELASAASVLLFLATLILIVAFFRVQKRRGGVFLD